MREEDDGAGMAATGEETFKNWTETSQDQSVGHNGSVIIAQNCDIFRCVRIQKILKYLFKNFTIVKINSYCTHLH